MNKAGNLAILHSLKVIHKKRGMGKGEGINWPNVQVMYKAWHVNDS